MSFTPEFQTVAPEYRTLNDTDAMYNTPQLHHAGVSHEAYPPPGSPANYSQGGSRIPPSQATSHNPIRDSGTHGVPEHHSQLSSLDQEMLAEAHEDGQYDHHGQTSHGSDEQEDAALEEHLSWIPKSRGPSAQMSGARLAASVVIPQVAPGIQSPFSRGWSPILTDHGVRPEEFLQFMDHLNVCKAASPPLQLLNLAGNIVGFTPVPFAFAISMGTQALATGGMLAVARIRITKYLERVNKQYFHERGLAARIAKQSTLPQMIGQPPDAPLLAPLPAVIQDASSIPSLRDRRMQALDPWIAPVRYADVANPSEEHNFLDKISAKMTAHKAERAEGKIVKEHMKHQEKEAKEREKMEKKMHKHGHEADSSDLAKFDKKAGKEGEKEQKAARKFMFVIIQDLQMAAAVASQHQLN